MRSNERLLNGDDVVNTAVGVEDGFNLLENDNGSICASATEFALGSQSWGEANGVVEGETKRLVNFFATFATVEEVGLDIFKNREQDAACGVAHGLSARASGARDDRSCKRLCQDLEIWQNESHRTICELNASSDCRETD